MRATDTILDCIGEYQEATADIAARLAHENAAQVLDECRPSDTSPDPWEYTKELLPCGGLHDR